MAWYDFIKNAFSSTTTYSKPASIPTTLPSYTAPLAGTPSTKTQTSTPAYLSTPPALSGPLTYSQPTPAPAPVSPTPIATTVANPTLINNTSSSVNGPSNTFSTNQLGNTNPAPIVPPPTGQPDYAAIAAVNDSALQAINDQIAQATSQTAAPSRAEAEQSSLLGDLTSAYQKLGGKAERAASLEAAAGVPEDIKRLKEISLQIAQRNAEFNRAAVNQEGLLAPQFVIDQNKNFIARQQAVEIGALTSVAQALQGNIKLAQDTVDRTINLEFQDAQNEVDRLKAFLDVNAVNLSREDKKKADALAIQLAERTRLLEQAKEDRAAVLNIAAEVAKNGGDYSSVIKARTPEEALQLGGSSLLAQPDTETVAAGGRIKLINTKTGEVIADLGADNANLRASISASGGYVPPSGTYSNYQRAFDNITQGMPVSQQKAAQAKLNAAIASGDTVAIKENLSTLALANLNAADRTQALGRTAAIASAQAIKEKINEYVAISGDTNILKGSLESAAQKIGATSNPELAALGSQMQQLFVTYRRAMTGVAFSPGESRDYKKILPDIYNINKLNSALLDQFISSLDLQSGAILSTQMGASNYDAIFNSDSPITVNNQTSNDPLLSGVPDWVNREIEVEITGPDLGGRGIWGDFMDWLNR